MKRIQNFSPIFIQNVSKHKKFDQLQLYNKEPNLCAQNKNITRVSIYQKIQHINNKQIVNQKMQKYRIKRTLGDGTFGTVFEAISPNQQIVAIKKIKKQKYQSMDECLSLREIKSLRKLDHPNIIKLKEVILANNQLHLVFEYLECNLLQVYMRAQQSGRTLTESQIKNIFYKMTQALAYLHKNGYFHRDLKPENILCHNLDVKLCDFGLARQIRSRPPFTEYVSTRWYRAPELLLHSGAYNSPVDIFALACIVIELFMMNPLFPGTSQIDSMNKIVDLLGTPRKEQWAQGYKLASAMHYNFPECKGKQLCELIPKASFEVVELLESMLQYSWRKRPSAAEILKHPYFENFKPQTQKTSRSQQQLKISFYDKPIVDLPKNIKIQNSKQVEMRKSLIKFGDSFTSTFNKNKKQKVQHKEQEKKQGNFNTSLKKKRFQEEDDHDISKKFDEMQEILLQLKMKEQMKNTNTQTRQYKYEPLPSQTTKEQQLRLRMFSLKGMAGTSSIPSLTKSPIAKNNKN